MKQSAQGKHPAIFSQETTSHGILLFLTQSPQTFPQQHTNGSSKTSFGPLLFSMRGQNFFAAAGFAQSRRERKGKVGNIFLSSISTINWGSGMQTRSLYRKGDERNSGRVHRVESLARGCALITQSVCANINRAGAVVTRNRQRKRERVNPAAPAARRAAFTLVSLCAERWLMILSNYPQQASTLFVNTESGLHARPESYEQTRALALDAVDEKLQPRAPPPTPFAFLSYLSLSL